MSHKVLITISNELKAMIDKYNRENPFEPLHISEIAQKAIYERLTKGRERGVLNPLNEVTTGKTIKKPFKVDSEPSHKAPIPIHEHVQKLHSEPIPEMQEPEKNEHEPSHKAPIPIHEHIHKLHSEPITETEEQVNEADFFDNEPDTTENTKEEPIHGIRTYKDKKELTLKQCEVCGKTFPAKTKRTVTCSPDCQKAKNREKRKENQRKK